MDSVPIEQYSFHIEWSEEDEVFIVTSPEFPGFSAFGPSRTEALSEAKKALELLVEQMQEEGETLPEPNKLEQYSGQTRVRMPRGLHAELSQEASRQQVSLNTLMVSYLQRGLGYERGARDERRRVLNQLEHLASSVRVVKTPTDQPETANSEMKEYDPLSAQMRRS